MKNNSKHWYLAYTVVDIVVSIAAGLLVMVSSELVVLLIVCVGINTGSAQQGEYILT